MAEILGTNNTPKIVYDDINNELCFRGNLYPENTNEIFQSYYDFIDKYVGDNISICFDIDYINSTSSKELLILFKYLISKKKI